VKKMPKIQIQISETLDKKIILYKIIANKKTKAEAILELINKNFETNPYFIQELLVKEQ